MSTVEHIDLSDGDFMGGVDVLERSIDQSRDSGELKRPGRAFRIECVELMMTFGVAERVKGMELEKEFGDSAESRVEVSDVVHTASVTGSANAIDAYGFDDGGFLDDEKIPVLGGSEGPCI